MKRVYKEYSGGKELVGYEYKGYYIEIQDDLCHRNLMYGATHRWYYITLKSGEICCYDRLFEAKERIEIDLREVR